MSHPSNESQPPIRITANAFSYANDTPTARLCLVCVYVGRVKNTQVECGTRSAECGQYLEIRTSTINQPPEE
ncbi:hypothetical protein WN51_11302 [Melipona quadrifasciata]|uniref:Uncharacterized protein n=1 Tax=Melipona quadrifasciata TaxID=166423 RepID=A0A0N0BJW2_9HYME|nr:hypothetical protein WN51_11302 [Melipona quadrifasciata]